MAISGFHVTEHANVRMRQRGIRDAALAFVLANADKSLFVGKGCRERWISRRELKELRRSGAPVSLLERSGSLSVVISEDEAVVTVYHKFQRTRQKKNKQHLTH